MYIKKLSKNGQISLPVALKKTLSVKDGEYVYIYKEAGQLVISRHHEDDHLNKVIFRNGRLSIPMELRKMLKICPNSLLSLEAHSKKGSIIITNLDNIEVQSQLRIYP
ncbi:AbrB/MazE/SpoVT family DNA-binding domain-containing protein [Bacillus sp. ISL-47]|uniref:AbrB/MazE/SpoVT family DNA-binding domain-containing protein n=1 Tax=Bacillus sp. ISL-47 TaxID=2819130 RepID=UPI001BE6AA3D|nr:AbrB/MazE/SpoVT family DNA-binding domain-containing protein [Bacillus sp. ISL-47]MBT2690867.1 AbrB/MazE/SpoVT family DNA-binding domain-containing protein [Bacillus sp. ISL-47]MBT2710972.1 AbrB/MazE/SpoVT family DNA-binding domain-containing protein [Pseudomonas sp. ISL-84]